ncbi:MAG: energy transducer TonB [Rhizomicrobium sp.]
MQQPSHDLRAFQTPASSPRRFISIGAVVLLHLVLIYALASGLASNMAQKVIQDVKVAVVQEKPPEHKLPPPPPPQLVKPPPPFVPPPQINIQNETPPPNAITQVTTQVQPPAPPPKAAVTLPTLARGVGNNCAARYYPAMAVRLGHQGETLVKVEVSAQGTVTNVTLAKSSGYDELDEAAIRCVTNGWHYNPATQNGQPVAGTREAGIVWKLSGG